MIAFRDKNGRLAVAMFVAAMVMLMAPVFAPRAQAGEYWQQKYERFKAVAGENLAIGDVLCIKGSDGLAYKADADSATLRPAVGVAGIAAATGANVEVVVRGVLAEQTEASPGARLFLSATAGAFTTTAPTNEQALGFVMPEEGETTHSSVYYITVTPPQNDGAGY